MDPPSAWCGERTGAVADDDEAIVDELAVGASDGVTGDVELGDEVGFAREGRGR